MPLSNYEKVKRWRKKYPEKWKTQYSKYSVDHKEQIQVRRQKHHAKNIETYREYNARWHRENRKNQPLKVRAMHLWSSYGMKLDDYNRMFVVQNGVCAACGISPEYMRHKVLEVDHDHITGAVRGLLCGKCNRALGLVKDQPWLLHKYLMSRPLTEC